MSEGERPPSPYGSPGEPPLRRRFRPPPGGRGDLREKGWVPLHRFVLWWFLLLVSDVLFYVVLTQTVLVLLADAWAAELRSRANR